MFDFGGIKKLSELGMGDISDYKDTRLEELDIGDSSYKAVPEFEPETITLPAFGADTNIDSYNQILAQTARDANDFYEEDMNVIAQAEVAECLEHNNYDEQFENVHSLFEVSEQSNLQSDYSTANFAQEVNEIMLQEDYDTRKVLFTAHNAHMGKFLHAVEEVGLEGEPFMRKDLVWPENDSQKWVRNSENWKYREIVSRAGQWSYFNVPGAKKLAEYL